MGRLLQTFCRVCFCVLFLANALNSSHVDCNQEHDAVTAALPLRRTTRLAQPAQLVRAHDSSLRDAKRFSFSQDFLFLCSLVIFSESTCYISRRCMQLFLSSKRVNSSRSFGACPTRIQLAVYARTVGIDTSACLLSPNHPCLAAAGYYLERSGMYVRPQGQRVRSNGPVVGAAF